MNNNRIEPKDNTNVSIPIKYSPRSWKDFINLPNYNYDPGLINDLGGDPELVRKSKYDLNEEYLNSPWLKAMNQWKLGKTPFHGLAKTALPAAAGALLVNPTAFGVSLKLTLFMNNPYTVAIGNSAALADATSKIATEQTKDFGENLLTAVELFPGVPLVLQLPKALSKIKRLPNQISRKLKTEERIDKLYYKLRKKEITDLKELETKEKEARMRFNKIQELRQSHPSNVSLVVTEGRPRLVDFSKIDDVNMKKLLDKYHIQTVKINNKHYIPEGPFRYTSHLKTGKHNIPIFGTDDYAEIELLVSSKLSPITNYSTKNPTGSYTTTNLNNKPLILSDNYIPILEHNKQYVLKQFPNSKPFGSSVGVTEAGLPTITDDIDLFIADVDLPQIEKLHGNRNTWGITVGKDDVGIQTYTVKLDNGKYGEAGNVDLNILYTDPKTGKAIGTRSMEIFKLLFPDEYQKALSEADRTKTSVQITKTPKELLEAVDFKKTILDSFESMKPKLVGRSMSYLHYGDSDAVFEGIKKYFESFLGNLAKHAPVDVSKFTNTENNKKLLKLMKVDDIVDTDIIASDPKKMRNVFLLWWMDNTAYGRGVKADNITYALKYVSTLPEKTSADVAGPGLNTVLFGNSGHTNGYYGIVQQKTPFAHNKRTPEQIVSRVHEEIGKNLKLTNEQTKNLNNFGIYDLNNLEKLSERIQRRRDLNLQLGDILETSGLTTNPYGNSVYFGGLRDFNKPGDVVKIISTPQTAYDLVFPIPLRARTLATNNPKIDLNSSIHTKEYYPKEFLKSIPLNNLKRIVNKRDQMNSTIYSRKKLLEKQKSIHGSKKQKYGLYGALTGASFPIIGLINKIHNDRISYNTVSNRKFINMVYGDKYGDLINKLSDKDVNIMYNLLFKTNEKPKKVFEDFKQYYENK